MCWGISQVHSTPFASGGPDDGVSKPGENKPVDVYTVFGGQAEFGNGHDEVFSVDVSKTKEREEQRIGWRATVMTGVTAFHNFFVFRQFLC